MTNRDALRRARWLTSLASSPFVRSSLPDLAYAVGFPTRYAANWSEAFDGRLERIFGYVLGELDGSWCHVDIDAC